MRLMMIFSVIGMLAGNICGASYAANDPIFGDEFLRVLEYAKGGVPVAQYYVGSIYLDNGKYEDARPWLELAVDGGIPAAKTYLAYLYIHDKNYEKALELLNLASAQGEGEASFELCKIYAYGWYGGVERSYEKMAYFFKLSLDQGCEEAKMFYGGNDAKSFYDGISRDIEARKGLEKKTRARMI